MRYNRLGRSGLKVSEISLGSWLTYGNAVGDETARACMLLAFEKGVNFFDSADVYNRGQAEEATGRVLSELRRQEYAVATKCFFPMSQAATDRGLSRKHIVESVHDSLRRLRVDHIDLYQCHRYDPEVEMFELVRTMDDLVRQGKILYWGVSEWPALEIKNACAMARALNACPPASNQPEYSLAARRVETNGVQKACLQEGLGLVVWSPLKQGILTGKYSGAKVPRDSRAASERMRGFFPELDRGLLERVDQLRPLAARHGLTLAQLALAWLCTREAVSSVIVGATRVEQVEENVAAATARLDDATLKEMDRLFPAERFP